MNNGSNIKYKVFGAERIDEAYSIYESNQWESYLGDKEKLTKAFENSLYCLGAFDEDNAVSNAFYKSIGLSEECNGYPVNTFERLSDILSIWG